ncbi:MAG: DNA repair protein RadC [Chlamydiota bacterium]
MTSLCNLPQDERPRERLLHFGIEALSLSELLAIVLGTGTKGKNVLQLADELLMRFQGLNGLLEASVEELSEIKGIGKTKAILLQAVFGIALKSRKINMNGKIFIKTSQAAFDLASGELSHQKQEMLLVILRNVKRQLIHYETVSVGTLSEVLIHPREVFYPAIRHKAHDVIIAHNHPSGDPTPSKADIELTRLLAQSSYILGIGLADHLVVGARSFASMRDLGYLSKQPAY